MKIFNGFLLKPSLYLLALAFALSGCKKDDGGNTNVSMAELTTADVSIVGVLNAQSGGNITSSGGANVTARGVCFGTHQTPTTSDSKADAGSGLGTFTVNFNLDGLPVGGTCYVRAYATNEKGTAYGNEVSLIIPQTVFAIGQPYAGGVIAYVDGTNLHGIIAASIDQDNGAEWGCEGTQIPGASGEAIGTGSQNTIDIEMSCTTFGTGANVCSNLVSGGYDDWYLPSKDELNLLYTNSDLIGGFTTDVYWSSSEHNNSNSWGQMFSTGEQQPEFKSHKHYIRAVRNF